VAVPLVLTGRRGLTGSLDLPSGRRVAFVGVNGADRSTLALPLRFCELSSGTALMNSHDLASYAAEGYAVLFITCENAASTRSTRSWCLTKARSVETVRARR
jgi:ABC-type enterochelin transport system ATPase subunit